jgi:hypothetical protein
MDYEETFAPVAKMTIVRPFLALSLVLITVVYPKWMLRMIIFYGDIDEIILMTQPLGYLLASSKQVCRLKISLYSLKQVPCAWFAKFKSTLLAAGFKQSAYNPFMFPHHTTITILESMS